MKPRIPQYELSIADEPFRLVTETSVDPDNPTEEQRRIESEQQQQDGAQLVFDPEAHSS